MRKFCSCNLIKAFINELIDPDVDVLMDEMLKHVSICLWPDAVVRRSAVLVMNGLRSLLVATLRGFLDP